MFRNYVEKASLGGKKKDLEKKKQMNKETQECLLSRNLTILAHWRKGESTIGLNVYEILSKVRREESMYLWICQHRVPL